MKAFFTSENITFSNIHIHGGEARDLKLEIPGTPPTVRICFDFFINNGRICMGFFCRQFKKKCTKTTYLNGFLEK